MKFSITNPKFVDTLVDFPVGLWPIPRGGDSRMILVVKAPREMAQTANCAEDSASIWSLSMLAMLLRMVC